jgi:hypothetical protein
MQAIESPALASFQTADHFDQLAPRLFQEGHHAVKVGGA